MIVDFDTFPLIRIILADKLDLEEVAQMYAALDGVVERDGHYVTVVDTTSITSMPNAVTRRALADGGKSFEHHARRWSLGTAIVFTNPLVRGAHTAFNWIRGDRFELPEVAVSSMDEAYDWALAQLESKSVSTDAIREHLAELRVAK